MNDMNRLCMRRVWQILEWEPESRDVALGILNRVIDAEEHDIMRMKCSPQARKILDIDILMNLAQCIREHGNHKAFEEHLYNMRVLHKIRRDT